MVSTHFHFSQKAAYGHVRASSYCTYSFFNIARYGFPVAQDAIHIAHEGGNLHLGGTVLNNFNLTTMGKIQKSIEPK